MALTLSHHLLVITFGILGNIISFLVYLAPVPTFYRIWKKKTTEGFQSVPYLVGMMSAMLWLYYALLKNNNALLLITINSFGSLIQFLYFIIFILYATKPARELTIKIFGVMNVGLFGLIVFSIQLIPNGVQIMGWICVAFSVSVFAAPLTIVAQVIRTKSVEFMPFSLSFFLTLSAIMWFVYGLFLKDICVAIPNVIGFILGLLQMLLYGIYRKRKSNDEIIIIKTIETLETSSISATADVNANANVIIITNGNDVVCKGNDT